MGFDILLWSDQKMMGQVGSRDDKNNEENYIYILSKWKNVS